MEHKIILKNVRGSYVYILDENKDGKYSMKIILDRNDPQVEEIKKLQILALRSKFGNDANPKKFKMPLRDGDEDDPNEKGKVFFNASNTRKPQVLSRSKELIKNLDSDNADQVYSGAYFHVSVNFYGFPTKPNSSIATKGVAVSLGNVMCYKDGERFSGGENAEVEFADFEKTETNNNVDDFDDFDDDDDDLI